MALSLDDKLLGEKTHYYCSSSEDEGEEEEEEYGSDREEKKSRSSKGPTFIPEPQVKEYDGRCTNVSFTSKIYSSIIRVVIIIPLSNEVWREYIGI